MCLLPCWFSALEDNCHHYYPPPPPALASPSSDGMSAKGRNNIDIKPTEKVQSQSMGANKQDLLLAELVKSVKKLQEEKEASDMFHTIAILNPETYDGTLDPVVLEGWLRAMEKLFEVLNCPDNRKVRYAVFYLKGRADTWWSMVGKLAESPKFGWEEFKDLMRKEFFPRFLRHQKEVELMKLEQGNMSVVDYGSKFLELSRLVPCIVGTEENKMEMFRRGLNGKLQINLLSESYASYNELFHAAMALEWVVKEGEEQEQEQEEQEQEQGGCFSRKAYHRSKIRRC